MSPYLTASRPRTLAAALCPVAAGCALAWHLEQRFSLLLAVSTLLSTLCLQIATNYFNDAVDAKKGADTARRLGPQRATASGLVSRKAMMRAGAAALLVAVLFSLPMVEARGWMIVLIGLVSLFFTYGYTGGPVPLAYRGLGELFVILFFGLIAVTGTVFVQTGHWHWEGLLAGLQIGSMSTALIAINNLRDITEDTLSRKRTLAVRSGESAAKRMIIAWCLLPYLLDLGWAPFHEKLCYYPAPASLLGVAVSVLVFRTAPSVGYNRFLALAGLHLLVWTALFVAACM